MKKLRLYKSGTTWCVWRWTDVDSGYIKRLHLVKTPFGAICLHWLLKPDPEPWLHDHPVTFLSIVLRGGYCECRGTRPAVTHHDAPFWFNFIRATDSHSICGVLPNTLTIAFMGPKVREWGFHTDKGWVCWRQYYKEKRETV